MPSMKKIKESMLKQAIPDEIIEPFDFTEVKGNRPEPMLALIEKMDELLTKEQCLAIMGEAIRNIRCKSINHQPQNQPNSK